MRSLHHRDGHHGWNRDLQPIIEVSPGDELELHLADCFDGQLTAAPEPGEVAALDLSRSNPLTGPVHVRGAAPGTVLAVEILEVAVGTVGWTTLIPGFGLLADEFPDPHVVVSHIGSGELDLGGFASPPLRPFLGVVGVASGDPGSHSVLPPRRVGGNLDCRDVRPGATLLLPVEVDGALLSAGDAHATQGDGEVCGTAVETAATARLRIDVRHDMRLDAPAVELPADAPAPVGPRYVTTGIGPDLLAGARTATRSMIEHLEQRFRLAAPDAYALCSVAGDLRIVEVVDTPNWVVAMELDLSTLV